MNHRDPPTHAYTLRGFTERYLELEQHRDDAQGGLALAGAEFALTGWDRANSEQAVLSPLVHRFNPVIHQPTIIREYDSVIGFSVGIPVRQAIFIYPVSNPKDVLMESIHLKYPFRLNAGEVSRCLFSYLEKHADLHIFCIAMKF
jgi:hypothetical protein